MARVAGYRRYLIALIGIATGVASGWGGFGADEQWQAQETATLVGNFIVSGLALWSAFRPKPAAGT